MQQFYTCITIFQNSTKKLMCSRLRICNVLYTVIITRTLLVSAEHFDGGESPDAVLAPDRLVCVAVHRRDMHYTLRVGER